MWPDHAGHAQALGGRRATVVVAAPPVGVGHDGLAADLVEGDGLRGLPRRRGQRHAQVHAFRVRDGPLQHLHAAHGAAHRGEQLLDAEVVQKHRLRVHHVRDGDDGEVGAVRPARRGVLAGRPRRTAAAADDVAADHEVLVGVQALAGTDEHVPPARAFVVGAVAAGHVRVAGQGVRDEDGVVLGLAERAVRLVGERERGERAAAFQGELLAGPVEGHGLRAHDAGRTGIAVEAHGHVADLFARGALGVSHRGADSSGGESAMGRAGTAPSSPHCRAGGAHGPARRSRRREAGVAARRRDPGRQALASA